MEILKRLRPFLAPGQTWVEDSAEMPDEFKHALGDNEEVKFFQRAQLGNLVVVTIVCRLIGIACILWGLLGSYLCFPVALIFFAIPFFLYKYEYAITETRVLVGKREFGKYSFNIISIDMVSGVSIKSATFPYTMFGTAMLEILHVGGPTRLPVLGGQEGQATALRLTRMLEEGRTDSARRRAQAMAAPVTPLPPTPTPLPAAAKMDKKTQLELLRQRLLEGSINQETYNLLREEIENS